jgi:hypothetical protein
VISAVYTLGTGPLVLAALQDPKLFNRPPGSSYRLPKARQRDLLIYPALLVFGASLLAACTGQWPYLPSQASAARPLASLPPPSRPIRKHKPPPATDALAPDAGVEVLAKAEPAAAIPAPFSPPYASATGPAAPQTSELIGLDQPEATRLLGATAEQFEKPPAIVWRYKNTTCELDLFFYLDLRSSRMRTLHYAVKGNDVDPAKRQDCVTSLRVAQSK